MQCSAVQCDAVQRSATSNTPGMRRSNTWGGGKEEGGRNSTMNAPEVIEILHTRF